MLGLRKAEPPSHQSRIDAIVAAARAGAPEPKARPQLNAFVANPVIASDDLLDRRLEEELRYAQRLVTAAGDRLADDHIVLQRHDRTLQSFDFLAQLLGHLATVIGSADRDAAIERIGMAELKHRLARPEEGVAAEFKGALYRPERNPFAYD